MLKAERFVKDILKSSVHKPRLKKAERVIFPTPDCPLPDFDDDLTDVEWVMLCHLVYTPELMGLRK